MMNDNEQYVFKAGTTAQEPYDTVITPENVGWQWCSLRIAALDSGQSIEIDTGEDELLVLPLSTGAYVDIDGERYDLDGRESVFTSKTDYLYIPRHRHVQLTAKAGGRIALPATKATADFPVRYCPASEAYSAPRGAAQASRQVTNYALGNAVQTSHLLVCEVLTPGGNWSSYPPHKHDENNENERQLEEIYYFEIRPAGENGEHEGFGLQEIYSSRGHSISVATEVRSGDTVAVPYGYHGPSAAAPFYDMYYLNVMGGPAEDSTWLMTDDPAHAWQREAWKQQELDSRLPFYPFDEEN